MIHSDIHLKVLLPFGIFLEKNDVLKINIETHGGYYGILPNRLDCTAAIPPGIMTYQSSSSGTHYIALDEGILVKTSNEVKISVRNALTGPDLGKLHQTLENQFKKLNEKERDVRNTIARLESSIVRQFEKFHKD